MRLVDGEEREQPALVQAVEQAEEAVGGHALGRGVEQRDLAAREAPLHVQRLLPVERGVEEGRLHPASCSAPTWSCMSAMSGETTVTPLPRRAARCRHLVAQRLAAARGHEHERVAAGDHVVDDGLLRATELVVAEDVVQDEMRGDKETLLLIAVNAC
ncbi:hypothetical protein ALISP_2284 [Alicycliphilus sp. B1]|nr:hypothetical protein ALISP_2284 [Alicycliphilus sp. B1]